MYDADMQAQQLQVSLAEQRSKEVEGRLADLAVDRANAQQQVQEGTATILCLSAQLQQADAAAADRLRVSCAHGC